MSARPGISGQEAGEDVNPLIARTRIVLIAPSLPDNVGSVARAMGTFGFSRLVLAGGVSPTHERARTLAAGHDAILEAATVVADFDAAIAGATLVVGTTARRQASVDRRAVEPAAGAAIAAAHAGAGEVALVFGTEKRGLSNAELRRCHQLVTIDGEPDTCLNLAQAAAVLLYEWRRAAVPQGLAPTALAAEAGIADLAGVLAEHLDAAGLLKPRERASKLHTLRRMLSRASLSADEAALVRGWLAALRYAGR